MESQQFIAKYTFHVGTAILKKLGFLKPEPFQDMKHFLAFFFLSSYEKFSETKVSQAEPGKYRRITWCLKIKPSIPSGDSEQASRGRMETLPLGHAL